VTLPDDIGLPTDAWDGMELGRALAAVARLATLAEVYSSGRHTLLAAANRRAAIEGGLRLTVHGPYEDLEPGSTSERRRRQAVATHRRHLEAAAEVGAARYVVHPDYHERPRKRDARVLAALERSIAELTLAQAETGVPVVVENMPGAGRSHFTGPGDLDLGELGFALDAGHAAITGVLHDFLVDPQTRLQHVHLHDNRGPMDAHDPHLALGRGVVDVSAVLATARAATATVILELLDLPAIEASVVYLRAKGLVAGPAAYTGRPPKTVSSTAADVISSAGVLRMSRLSTTKSAVFPTSIEPISSSRPMA
jgi:sugar phosphate isomerase/epimerase